MTLYIRIKSCTEVVDKKGKTNTFVMQFQEYGTTNSVYSSRFHGDKPKFKDEILEMPIKKYDKHRLLCDITTCSQDNPVILAQLVFHLSLLPKNKQTKITFVYPKIKYTGSRIQASIEFHYSTNDDEPFDVPFKEIKVEEFQKSMKEGANATNNDNKRYTVKAGGYTDEDERVRAVSEKIQRNREETAEESDNEVQFTKSSETKNYDSKSQKTFVADMPVAPMMSPPPTDIPSFDSQGHNSAQFINQPKMQVSSPPPASSQLPPMDTWIHQRLQPVPKPPADRIQYFTQFQQTVKEYQAQYGPQYAKQYYDQNISYFQDCTNFLAYSEERKKLVMQYQQLQQQQAMHSHTSSQYNALSPQNPPMNYSAPQQQQSLQQIQILQQQINMLISQQQQMHQQQQSMQQIQQLQQQMQFLQQQLQQQQNQQQNQPQQPQSPPQQFNSNQIPVQIGQNPQQNIQYQQQYQYNQQQSIQNVPQNQYQNQYQQTQQPMISQLQNQYQQQIAMHQQQQYQQQFQYNYNNQMMNKSDSNPQLNYLTPPQQNLPNDHQQLYSMQQPQQPNIPQVMQQMQNEQQIMQSMQQPPNQLQQMQQIQQMQMMPPNQQMQPEQQQQLQQMTPQNQPAPPVQQLAQLPVMQQPPPEYRF